MRPAFYLNLESVLFTSAAVGGKFSGSVGADALTAVETNSNNEWKLTVKDDAHADFSILKTTPVGSGVSVKYTGAQTGTKEYISAIKTDETGAVTYYGRIAAVSDAAGTVTINTAGKFGENDHLYVFNEQYNGDKKTDYASELTEVTIPALIKTAIPTGKTLTYNSESQTGVAAGSGYTLSGTTSATNAGSYQATATLDEGRVWSDWTSDPKTISWNINPKVVTPDVTLSATAYTYNGKAQEPTITVKVDSVEFDSSQYDVTYASGCKNVGTYKVTVKMKGNYSGSQTVSFNINTASINSAVVAGITDDTYTGKALTQSPVVKIGSTILKSGTDYTVSYKNNTNVGTATVTIIGKGNYTGTVEKTFKITAKKITPNVTLSASSYTYDGKVKKPTVTVKDGTTKLDASQYTVTYKNNKNVGKASATVTLKGNYSGSKTMTFKINPKGTSLKTLTKASKAVRVKWTKQASKMSSSRITGYQIQLATDSKFTKNKKTVTVKGYSKVSKKVTKLKGSKKYYVRIRTYMKVSGTKYYSPWSKVKTIKTKK